jgi:protein-tyrosine phosphatase
MAEVLLRSRLASIEATETVVSSAGLLPPGFPAPPEAIKAMEPYGLDLSAHRSRRLSIDEVLAADLILGLDRRHVREIVLLNSESWPYTFTLPELVRRGEQVGPRRLTVTEGEWVLEAQNGRQRADLVGRSAKDEVADPIGGPSRRYKETAALLHNLVGRLVDVLCPGRSDADRWDPTRTQRVRSPGSLL